jgi:hypothetical protein
MDTTTASLTFGNNSRLFRTLDTQEVSAGNASMEDSWDDYLKFGLSSAVVSAGVGIMNTAVAFGEMIGVADSSNYFDESASVNNLLGADAQSFYDRHKEGIDALGFVAGSLVPGLAAIRGLRALQVAGKVSSPLEALTGLRNPDILLDSTVVAAAKRAALEQTTAAPNWFAPHMIKAYAQGAKQQLAESLAFEAGVLVTMNQNATLNPDDLGYLDAIKDQWWDATKFAALGGAIGGTIDAFRVVGAVRKFGNEEWSRTAELSNLQMFLSPNHDNLIGGSKLLDLGRAAASRAKLLQTIDSKDWFALKQFNAGQEQLKSSMLKVFSDMNVAGKEGIEILTNLVETVTPERLESLGTVLSGLTRIENVGVKDFQDLAKFYDMTKTTTIISRGNSPMDVVDELAVKQEELSELINRISPDAGEGKFAFEFERFQVIVGKDIEDAAAFAFVGNSLTNAGLTSFNVKSVRMKEGTLAFIPDFVGFNEATLEATWEISKAAATRSGRKFDMSLEDFHQYAIMHELSHIKNNSEAAKDFLTNSLIQLHKAKKSEFIGDVQFSTRDKLSKKYQLFRDLIGASFDARYEAWARNFGPGVEKLPREGQIDIIMEKLTTPGWQNSEVLGYFGSPAELLADGAAQMVNPKTREMFAKRYPLAAKFFNAQGALAKAWEPTKAYYNSRTREIMSSYLPGLRDVDPNLKITHSALGTTIRSDVLNKTFSYDIAKFSPAKISEALTQRLDFQEYDAMWNIADSMTARNFVDENGFVRIASDDLPRIEKLLDMADKKDAAIVAAFDAGKVFIGESVAFKEGLDELLKQRKMDLRDILATSKVGYNEHQIAKILNIDLPNAMGEVAAKDTGWKLLGIKDYTKPEIFAMRYDHKSIQDYDGAVANIAGVAMHDDAVNSQILATAAELTGDLFHNLPTLPTELLGTISPFASRAGLLNNLRAEFNTLREKAAYIGKLVGQKSLNLAQEVDSAFAKHASIFNRADNVGLRFELANIDNILRREHYYLAQTSDGPSIIRKDKVIEAAKAAGVKFDVEYLNSLPDEFLDALRGVDDAYAPGVVKLSPEVAEFYSVHAKRNFSLNDRVRSLAITKGKTSTRDPNILYAPSRDLRGSKYVGFVIPKTFKAESDPRRFMIYAETEAEFESKRLGIEQKYGADYRLLTKKDAKEYQDALGEYADGSVFDEIEFDSNLFNKGRSSELLPNTDTNFSATLDRYRVYHIKQEDRLLKSGVELKYNGIVQGLKRMDDFFGKVEASSMDKTWREPATIWQDTLSTMLNTRARGSNLENMWVRVNDFLGEKGSKLVESTLAGLSKARINGRLTQEDLNVFNAKLAEAGYKSPFDSVMQVALASPDTSKSSIFPSAVKTLSNLISTTMLRLDFAHSILSVISSPILTLPVLQEAKLALRDTPAGLRLKEATTVLNPATGQYEPSNMKLMFNAVRAFWSPEGKQFIQEMQARNIINDHLSQYLQVTDFSQINGRHAMKQVNDKIEALAYYGSKVSGFNYAEQFSRFLVAHAVKDIAEIRGLPKEEAWSLISGAVDKVHGVYSGAQRPQLFQGVLGQSVGLYQTYFFNFVQNMLKFVADGNKKQATTMLAMQSSIFGIQSLPGFQTLNEAIGNTNRNNTDLYSVSNADDPESWSKYAMYGLASHMFGTPIDFTTRGSLSARNMLVIPTTFQDLPIVGTLAKVYENLSQTVSALSEVDTISQAKQVMLHGMAHNGLNRPLQGVASIILGDVYTKEGQINWINSNYVGYNVTNDWNFGAMFARAIGTRPLNETIVQSAYFRDAAYKANYKKNIADISSQLQLDYSVGQLSTADMGDFALRYERAGGEIQSFNAYWGRQLKQAGDGVMNKFQDELLADKYSSLGRAVKRMELKQSTLTPWDTDY